MENYTIKDAYKALRYKWSINYSTFEKASSDIRRVLGLERLTPELRKEVHTAVEKHNARQTMKNKLNKLAVPSGRILKMQTEKRMVLAVALGESYNKRIKSLYTSKRAVVEYGHGGIEHTDWNAYSKSYGRPANWKNAGARWEGHILIIENFRGTKMAAVEIDPRFALADHPALIDGDLYGIEKHGIILRFGISSGKIIQTGVAVAMPIPSGFTQRVVIAENGRYWEHGETIADCKIEHEYKCEIGRKKIAEQVEQVNAAQIARAERLIYRLCNNLPVSYQDAREMGYCDAGIRGWCQRNNIDPNTGSNLAFVRGRDSQADRLAHHVAKKCATQIVTASA